MNADPRTIDRHLGDPLDDANPFSHETLLAADERAELLADGERALDAYGLNAEFVPRALGGRLRGLDELVQVLRAVFRRDPSLALGYGFTNYIAGAPVWASGSDEQRRWMADLLLRHRKVSAGYNELAHGNDFTRTELMARQRGSELVLDGRKELVNNVVRADAITLFARTDERPGNRSHSHIIVEKAAIPADRWRDLQRFPTAGMRGCLLGGIEFQDCPVPMDRVVGPVGGGMETVLRAFQTTRTLLAGMAVGGLDTQLRLATRFATERRLYGRTVGDLPHARSTLAWTFVDVLACDAFATTVARALHVLPRQAGMFAAAGKYLVPKIIHEDSYRLSVLLGARSYLREGTYGMFQKSMRDTALATFGHANATVCQATMIPQLARLAERSRLRSDGPPDILFRFGEPLDDLDFGALALTGKGEDSLTAVIHTGDRAGSGPALTALRKAFAEHLERLRDECAALPPQDRTVIAGRRAFALADRYAVVLAAASCLGVWLNASDPFLAGERWITAALWRLGRRLGLDVGPAPAGIEEEMYAELVARRESGRTFDLSDRALAGRV